MFKSPFSEDFSFVVIDDAQSNDHVLYPEEEALLSPQASEKRRREFLLGRAAAHRALQSLGFNSPPPVLRGEGREPLWPKDVIGSISHESNMAVAAASFQRFAQGIGVDLQKLRNHSKIDIAREVCRPSELEWINSKFDQERALYLIALFSAKESIYKAFYPITKKFLGFKDVVLIWQESKSNFKGSLVIDLLPKFNRGFSFEVSVQINQNTVFTSITI